jgi:hypothetical protein
MGDEGIREKQDSDSSVLETFAKTPIAEIDVLWITAGLGLIVLAVAMSAQSRGRFKSALRRGCATA